MDRRCQGADRDALGAALFTLVPLESGSHDLANIVKGVAAILDASGKLVGRATFEPTRLLPVERAVVHAEYPGVLAAGPYRALATFEYEGKAFTKSAEFLVR